MDSALLGSSHLVFDFARCVISNGEGDVVGSMDSHNAAIIRDERGAVISTSRTRGGFVRQEKRTFCTDEGQELGYISGRDVCAPNGKVLARIVNSHHFNVGSYDIVDADQRVIARGELSRTAGKQSIRGLPVAFGESHWELDLVDDISPQVRALIIAGVPHWRGKALLALSDNGADSSSAL
jgi:hypothetical protein